MNKQDKKGFFILSFVLYILLFTLLTSLAWRWSFIVIRWMQEHNRSLQKNAQQELFVHLLMYDIYHAPYKNEAWITRSNQELFWKKEDMSIEWKIVGNQTIRKKRIYHAQSKKWKTITKTIFTYKNLLFFEVQESKGKIYGIRVRFQALPSLFIAVRDYYA